MIAMTMAAVIFMIAVLAWFFPAPLQPPAAPYEVPNPSKSAWFLLWLQELVSYHANLMYLVLLLYISFFIIPYLVIKDEPAAVWFNKKYRWINILTLLIFLAIIALTVIAMFFRGEYWQFTL